MINFVDAFGLIYVRLFGQVYLHVCLFIFNQLCILFNVLYRKPCPWVLGCWYFNWAIWSLHNPSCAWNKSNCWIWSCFSPVQHWAGGVPFNELTLFLFLYSFTCIVLLEDWIQVIVFSVISWEAKFHEEICFWVRVCTGECEIPFFSVIGPSLDLVSKWSTSGI